MQRAGVQGHNDQGDTLDEIVETLEELIELIQDMIPEKVYEYVELAPNFTWCTMNVGADKVTETGDFFALAETETKEVYSRDTWKWVGNTDRYYAPTGVDDFLKAEDDAATVNWGAKYRTPTRAEWEALRNKDNFTWTYTDSYKGSGVAGDIVTSKVPGYEGKSIFLPHTGHYGPNGYSNYTPNADVNPLPAGCYWTSTVTLWSRAKWMGDALFCWNFTNPYQMGSYDAYYGMAVRAIYDDGNFECPAEPAELDPYNGHAYVNMGHDLVWATANVGAANEYEFGDFFMWGEVAPNTYYGHESYKFMNEVNGDMTQSQLLNLINKYQIEDGWTAGCWYDANGGFIGDGKTTLEAEDDAAAVNMGGIWRMPTKDEYAVLLNPEEYDWEWIQTDQTYYDDDFESEMPVEGFKVTCKINGDCYGNWIFLPATGEKVLNRWDTGWGTTSGYWSSSLCDDIVNNANATARAYHLAIETTNAELDNTLSRCYGYVVRGVAPVVE